MTLRQKRLFAIGFRIRGNYKKLLMSRLQFKMKLDNQTEISKIVKICNTIYVQCKFE